MLDIAYINGFFNIILIITGCCGVALQAVITALRFLRRLNSHSHMRTACEGAVMLHLSVCVFCLSAVRQWLLDGTVLTGAFTLGRFAACGSAFLLCVFTTWKARKWDYAVLSVLALITAPCFDDLPGFRYVFILAILFTTVRAAILVRVLLDSGRTHISRMSIKHALDTLPDGILFARYDGSVTLQNKMMMELTHHLTGEIASDAEKLWRFMQSDSWGDYVKLFLSDGRVLLRMKDGKAWEFSKKLVDMNGKSILRILAADVTDADRITRELEGVNHELSSTAEWLQYILDNYNEIKTVREAIEMKLKLHDRMGQRISLVSRSIADDTEESYKEIVPLLRGLLDDLTDMRKAAAPFTLADLQASFAVVGTTVVLHGALPADERGEALLHILREAATNAVRHAGATMVDADVAETQSSLCMSITNDGKLPEENLREGGGIGGMRVRLAALNGRLTVETRPVFKLTAAIKKETV